MGTALLMAQAIFVGVFFVRAFFGARSPGNSDAPRAQERRTAPWARALILIHVVGSGIVVRGITGTFVNQHSRVSTSPRVLVGLACIIAASALAGWALLVFRSWRLLARLDVGHALCVAGPYRFVRHPLYLAMDLWAVGSALSCPHPATLVGAAVVFLGSDLRARAEEDLLVHAFGEVYRTYAARTRRFVPRLY